jgi:hypothetical protein
MITGWRCALGSLALVAGLFLAVPGAAQDAAEPLPDASVAEPAPEATAATTAEAGSDSQEAAEADSGYPELRVTTVIHVSPDIVERRDEIIAFISAQPGWAVGREEEAEFQLVPNPEYYQDLLFSRIQRYTFDRSRDRFATPAMDIAEIMIWNDPQPHVTVFDGRGKGKIVSPDRPGRPEWGSRIPVPTDLGAADGPELLERLGAAMAPIARHHALLGLVTDQDGSLDICVAHAPAVDRTCPVIDNASPPELMYFKPLYIRVSGDTKPPEGAREITVLAVAPDRTIIPLFTSPITLQTKIDSATGEPLYRFWADNYAAPSQLDDLHRYHIIALASPDPLDPRIWSLMPGDPLPEDICVTPLQRRICETMRGDYDMAGDRRLATGVTEIMLWTDQVRAVAPVGGNTARLADGKWQAQLFVPRAGPPLGVSGTPGPGGAQRQNFEKSHKCGGSYLGDGYILTAAHCVAKRSLGEMQVRLGTLDIAVGGSNFPILSMVIHSDYGKSPGNADIALLRIRTDARLDALLRKGLLDEVELAPANERLTDGTPVMITGWGFTGATDSDGGSTVDRDGLTQRNARYLIKVSKTTLPASECLKFAKLRNFSAPDIICARAIKDGEDACFGDSGGPLTRLVGGKRVLVGIVAAGIGCAVKGVPGVYTRVANFRLWIDKAKEAATKPGKHIMDRNGRVVG